MSVSVPGPAPYIYVCTRLRARRAALFTRPDYLRMLNMRIPQIIRFVGEHGYGKEVHIFSDAPSDIDHLEDALTKNLAASFEGINALVPGHLHILTAAFQRRWDITSIMAILRQKKKGLSQESIRDILVPAGDFDRRALDRLLAMDSEEQVIGSLSSWVFHPVLNAVYQESPGAGLYGRLENRLYQQYYADLLHQCTTGIKGGNIFLAYVKWEIDLLNFKNLMRLRAGTAEGDIRPHMVTGGTIRPDEIQQIFSSDSFDQFIRIFKKTHLHQVFLEAFHALRSGPETQFAGGDELVYDRWQHRKRPLHELVMVVLRMRLERMERTSKRYPFSILPVLVYLERKKYEVFNIRAIIRGKEDNLPADLIQKYLIL